MQLWQIIILAFLVAMPLALMVDYWGDQRLSSRGRPGSRQWRPSPGSRPEPDEHDEH